MPVMAIMTGIQASGKSTFCKSYLTEYDRINLDTLHTRNKENTAMEVAFLAKRDMVIDNTNPTAQNEKVHLQGKRKWILCGRLFYAVKIAGVYCAQ